MDKVYVKNSENINIAAGDINITKQMLLKTEQGEDGLLEEFFGYNKYSKKDWLFVDQDMIFIYKNPICKIFCETDETLYKLDMPYKGRENLPNFPYLINTELINPFYRNIAYTGSIFIDIDGVKIEICKTIDIEGKIIIPIPLIAINPSKWIVYKNITKLINSVGGDYEVVYKEKIFKN